MAVDSITIARGSSAFLDVIIDMVETHERKKADYAGEGDPNQNFYDTAYQLSSTAGLSVEQLLATKAARLRVLLPALGSGGSPKNESVEDTILDRAVYAVIALTIWREGGYHQEPQGVRGSSSFAGANEVVGIAAEDIPEGAIGKVRLS